MDPRYKAAEIQITDEERREVQFVASDESVDRYGDIIRVDGWELSNFRKNPVLLFGHDSMMPPIGTVPKISKDSDSKQLVATARILPEGTYEFADTIWKIMKAGALRAVSVGFMPIEKPTMIRDEENDRVTGFEYTRQELLELSVVPVPANPMALALAKSLALNPEYVKRLFVQQEGAFAQEISAARNRIARLSLRVSSITSKS